MYKRVGGKYSPYLKQNTLKIQGQSLCFFMLSKQHSVPIPAVAPSLQYGNRNTHGTLQGCGKDDNKWIWRTLNAGGVMQVLSVTSILFITVPP